MHELSIAESIVNTVNAEIDRQKLGPVSRVVVRIGALTDIVPDALQFGYEVLVADTRLNMTALIIEEIPAKGDCAKCGDKFEVAEFVFVCPNCHSHEIKMTQGDELDIAYLEVED